MGINFTDSLGQTIAFEVYPSSVIGTRFNNAIVRGVVDHSGVTEFNPAVMHANVFATLPSGSVDDFRKYNYLRLELENGNITFVGIPWIIANSVQVISNQDLVINIPKYGSHENQEFIKRMLLNNGITEFTIDTK
jgi:hypothetical protein